MEASRSQKNPFTLSEALFMTKERRAQIGENFDSQCRIQEDAKFFQSLVANIMIPLAVEQVLETALNPRPDDSFGSHKIFMMALQCACGDPDIRAPYQSIQEKITGEQFQPVPIDNQNALSSQRKESRADLIYGYLLLFSGGSLLTASIIFWR